MTGEVKLLPCARELLAKHLLALNSATEAAAVMRGEWDNGADIKAIVEALSCPTLVTGQLQEDGGELVERVAEALWRAEWAEGHEPPHSWDAMCSEDWDIAEAFRAQARAAITAIAATRAATETPTPGLTDDVVKELVEALSEAAKAFKRIADGEVGQPENLAFNGWQMIEGILERRK